jgi:hypothetical protein
MTREAVRRGVSDSLNLGGATRDRARHGTLEHLPKTAWRLRQGAEGFDAYFLISLNLNLQDRPELTR